MKGEQILPNDSIVVFRERLSPVHWYWGWGNIGEGDIQWPSVGNCEEKIMINHKSVYEPLRPGRQLWTSLGSPADWRGLGGTCKYSISDHWHFWCLVTCKFFSLKNSGSNLFSMTWTLGIDSQTMLSNQRWPVSASAPRLGPPGGTGPSRLPDSFRLAWESLDPSGGVTSSGGPSSVHQMEGAGGRHWLLLGGWVQGRCCVHGVSAGGNLRGYGVVVSSNRLLEKSSVV